MLRTLYAENEEERLLIFCDVVFGENQDIHQKPLASRLKDANFSIREYFFRISHSWSTKPVFNKRRSLNYIRRDFQILNELTRAVPGKPNGLGGTQTPGAGKKWRWTMGIFLDSVRRKEKNVPNIGKIFCL